MLDMTIGSPWKPYERGFRIDSEKPSDVVLTAIAQRLILPEDRVLDLGCGKNPRNAVYLARDLNCQVDGIDEEQPELPNDSQIARNLNLKEGSIFDLEYPENTYQVALLARLIQYLSLEDLEQLIKNVHQTLVPQGILLLSYTAEGGVLARGKDYEIEAYAHPVTTVLKLLKESGFKIESTEIGSSQSTFVPHKGEPAITYDIIAQKTNETE